MQIGGGLEVKELPFEGSPQLCSMSKRIAAADWIARNRPGATIQQVKCREGRAT